MTVLPDAQLTVNEHGMGELLIGDLDIFQALPVTRTEVVTQPGKPTLIKLDLLVGKLDLRGPAELVISKITAVEGMTREP